MDEAEYLADRVIVIAAGEVVAQGSPSTLGARDRASARVHYRLPVGVAPPPGLGGSPDGDGFVQASMEDPVVALHELTGWALQRGVDLEGLEVIRPSLEDIYLSLTRATANGNQAASTVAEVEKR